MFTYYVYTVWRFQDFSVTQIIREINFGESRNSKTAIVAILRALNLVILINFKCKFHRNQNSEPLNVLTELSCKSGIYQERGPKGPDF